MANDLYENILAQSDIQRILEHYGLNITKNRTKCPFHNDKNPSMYINDNKRIAKCFSCGAGGNSISFIQKYENEINHNNITIKDAMKKAVEIQGLNIKIEDSQNLNLSPEEQQKQKLQSIVKDALLLIENNLKMDNAEVKKAIKYLSDREISKETMNNFHIGYAPINSNYIIDKLKQKYSESDLIKVGIMKINEQGKANNIFFERIMIPIFDEYGRPVGFGGRTLNENMKPKYLNTNATELFNKSNLLFNYHKAKYYAREDELIIVEGYFDVISAKEIGIDNIVATMGTALTEEHIQLIKKLNCEVVLALDNDEAGKEAMIRTIPELLDKGLKVSIFDISQIGNYKDFGDLHMAKITREQIYSTKLSAFEFLLEHKYLKQREVNVDNITDIYSRMKKDKMIKNSRDEMRFKEYCMKKKNYSKEDIEKIISPENIKETTIDKYKDIFFYYYIMDKVKNYAIKKQNRVLLKFLESGKLNYNDILRDLDNEKYLKSNELTINISLYVNECIMTSEDYIKFKSNKVFQLEELLNNIKMFDEKGDVIDIELTIEQKEKVIEQYNNSFDNSIKEYIENNTEEFEEIFIANTNEEFENLFPETYVENIKDQTLSRFRRETKMEAIRYALAYPEKLKSVLSRKYVNNEKYKTLLVFNNTKGNLIITKEQIKKEEVIENEKKNEEKQEEKVKKENEKNPMSIFISLTGNEKETSKGIYLPVNEGNEIYIPQQLYKKNGKQIEIISNRANISNMSEYQINQKEQTKKWINRLSLQEFCHKYAKLYEVKMEVAKEGI